MAIQAHDRIIKKAASEILVPLGLFQKGQSRCWLDDNGWYITQVEFQPSAWSKGAYLNVGVSFLWKKSKALDETLSFDIGYRENAFVEFSGDEAAFYGKMVDMSVLASEKVVYYRKFNDLDYCGKQLGLLAGDKNSFWGKWNAAMFCFLVKDDFDGKRYLREIVETTETGLGIEWIDTMVAKCQELLVADMDLSQFVSNSICDRRGFFHSKPGFKKMTGDTRNISKSFVKIS